MSVLGRPFMSRTQSRARTGLGSALALALAASLLLPASALGKPLPTDRIADKPIESAGLESQAPNVGAVAGVILGPDGRELWSREESERRAVASVTKTMTGLIVLERASLDETVTVSRNATKTGYASGLVAGEQLSVGQLLEYALVASSNDAAVALAEHVAGSADAFVALMNQRAAELGMRNTRFANPHGLDEADHTSSAYDLWLATQEALQHPLFRQIVATPAYTTPGRQLFNQNELLGSYPGADGVKTGTTLAAGQNLVGSVTEDGHREIAVIMGSQDRYSDARALFDTYSNHWRWAAAPQPEGPASWLWAADDRPLRAAASAPPDLFLPNWQWPLVRPQLILSQAGAEPGQPSAVIRWYLGNQLLAEAPAILLAY